MKGSKLFYAILFCILLITFYIRTFNYDAFMDDEHSEVIISDNDAGYHLRRIVDFATGTSDQIQFPDIRSYYPEGYVCHWSPGFDFLLGTLGKTFYFFKPDVYSLKIFICLLIPILAVLTVFAYYFLSAKLLPPAAALISALLFALLPFHITITYFALVDHHVAEFYFWF
ncbi:MAG: hypothetical protein HC887_08730 [Desulfobacteraceae bacterium]|nr:hypothetical protein [Desulfobacteraceae bacterium]